MNQSYIYKITNLVNGRIYVGQHDGSKPRYFASGVLIRRALRKHGKEAFSREIIVSGNYTQQELDALEMHYITLFQSYFHDYPEKGYNLNKGGGGQRGHVLAERVRARLRATHPTNKPVIQFDTNGNRIAEYPSAKAAADALGILHSSISRACSGQSRTAGGFCWAHQETYEDSAPVLRPSKAVRSVAQYALTGEHIKTYSTIAEAVAATGFLRSGIANALAGARPTASGYLWRYADGTEAATVTPYDRISSVTDAATARTRPVEMLAPDGAIIRHFNSCAAAAAFMGSPVSGVRNCCIGKTKLHKGHQFRYALTTH